MIYIAFYKEKSASGSFSTEIEKCIGVDAQNINDAKAAFFGAFSNKLPGERQVYSDSAIGFRYHSIVTMIILTSIKELYLI